MISAENIIRASHRLRGLVNETPLQRNLNLSERLESNVYLKREDLQLGRSYKIRGAYNFISNLGLEDAQRGVVCASAGNHAQGFAYSCRILGISGKVYMPTTTPSQKVVQVQRLGKSFVEVVLVGDTFDAASQQANDYCRATGKIFVPPFDSELIMEGQGTVAVELMNQFTEGDIDYLFIPVGGGGLAAGIGSYMRKLSPQTRIIGVEPLGAPAMYRAFEAGKVVELPKIDTFVDGAAVKKVGKHTLPICLNVLDDIVLVPEGKICTFILQLYNLDAIVAEPAGALSIAALDFYADKIKGKNVVCILSGGNNDIERMPEIKERSLMYEGLKHYFIVRFPQRAGALRDFLDKVLGPTDDITDFEYTKKTARNNGPALVGIELKQQSNYEPLLERMVQYGFEYIKVNENSDLFSFLV